MVAACPSRRLEVWDFTALTLFDTRSTGVRFRRSMKKTRSELANTVSVITQSKGTAEFSCHGTERRLDQRCLGLVAHMTSPYAYAWSEEGRSVSFSIDIDRLGLPADVVTAAIPLTHHSPVEPLLLQHVRAMHSRADALVDDPSADALGQATVELTKALVVSVVGDTSSRREVARETLLTRVLAYIRAHITEPDLTPARIAAAHSISPRTLYRLCSDNGLSLEKWIIRRRLDGVRGDLADPGHAHRTVSAIARS